MIQLIEAINILTRKRNLLAILFVLITTMVALLVTVQTAYVAPLYLEGETDSFRYTVQEERNASLYVNISVNLDDPIALQKYLAANQQRGRNLAAKGPSPIPVRVTFLRPLPLDEARTLVHKTGLDVTSFAMVGYSSLNGRKGMHIEFSSLDKDVFLRRNIDPTGQGEELVLKGVMVLYGELKNPQGLMLLLDDPRVYLADTSETQVRELLAQKHRSAIMGKELVFSVPSPFWNLDW